MGRYIFHKALIFKSYVLAWFLLVCTSKRTLINLGVLRDLNWKVGNINMNALTIAATGMMAQQQRTEVVANNLANMNTFGYQKRRVEFNNLLYKHSTRGATVSSKPGDTVPGGVHLGMGVQLAAIYRVNEPGSLKQTGGSFDMAIEGKGFFQIQLPDGEIGYTRDGAFQQNETGTLVTHNGFPVQPGIVIPPNTSELTISSDGSVQAKIAGTDEPVIVGQLQLALFPNSGGLKAAGPNGRGIVFSIFFEYYSKN